MAETLNAILFIIAVAGTLAVGLALLPYMAMTFLAVVEQTAAGIDHVNWPEEPFLSRLLKPVYLAWQVVVWFVLLWIPLLVIAPGFGKAPAGAITALIVAIWLLFPISLFSALSSESPLLIFYPPLFGRLKGRGLAILTVYGMTGLFLALGVGTVLLGLLVHGLFLPLAAFVSMLALVLHARVLGRLAWLLSDAGPKTGKRAKRALVEADAPNAKPGAFPAPLPKPQAAIPMAIPLSAAPPAVPPSYFEAIQAGEPVQTGITRTDGPVPLAILVGPGMPPLAKLVSEEEHVPVLDVDEVSEEPTAAATPATLADQPLAVPDDLTPLPLPDDDEVLDLAFETPATNLSLDDAVPGLAEPISDEPGLLPLPANAPKKPEAATDLTPYLLQNDPASSWRAETGLGQAAPVPARPLRRAEPSEPWGEAPRPISVEYTTRIRAEKPLVLKHPLIQGVYDFPFYYRSVRPLLYLTVMGLLELLFIKLMIVKFPTNW